MRTSRSGRHALWRLTPLIVLTLIFVGCKGHEFHPPDEEERVEAAGALYSPAMFDTVSWSSDADRIDGGNLVYASTCRRCHGTLGRGDTEYARARELAVPSLVEPNWAMADSLDSLRRSVFTGHANGMPTFSLSGLSPREIDAVSGYILLQLRPEVLGAEGAPAAN